MNETSGMGEGFVETLEHRRFAEFCDACRDCRHIGLCHGPPGVGKTLSARRYAQADRLAALPPPEKLSREELEEWSLQGTVFHTAPVVNSPGRVERAIAALRGQLHGMLLEPLRREEEAASLAALERERDLTRQWRESLSQDWSLPSPPKPPPSSPSSWERQEHYQERRRAISDPTRLVIIDEADRFRMASLEAARAVFDQGGTGLVLIGMPGMEKRLTRYPQFYSRIGFVHTFRPLSADGVRSLLSGGWTPPGAGLPPLSEEAVTAAIRVTGGNFRLLDRLLAQTGRIARINGLSAITAEAVHAARESLVIGQ